MKQLEIRNEPRGLIWQIYHVNSDIEINLLCKNAIANGFVTEICNEITNEETFPGWRETNEWKTCLALNQC